MQHSDVKWKRRISPWTRHLKRNHTCNQLSEVGGEEESESDDDLRELFYDRNPGDSRDWNYSSDWSDWRDRHNWNDWSDWSDWRDWSDWSDWSGLSDWSGWSCCCCCCCCCCLLLLLLLFVAAAVAVRGTKISHSIYNNSRSTAPAAVMLMIIMLSF